MDGLQGVAEFRGGDQSSHKGTGKSRKIPRYIYLEKGSISLFCLNFVMSDLRVANGRNEIKLDLSLK